MSPALFPLPRTAPRLGRLFVEEDAREGAGRVALLSHGAWIDRYGSDPDVIGAALDLDGEAFTIVGVLPEGFSFPSPEVETWTPLVVPPFEPGAIGLNFPALGRLSPGVSPKRAAAEVGAVLNADRSPSDSTPRLEARVIPLQEEMVRGYRPALLVLSAVTALVLAIAGISAAGLFLAHGVARRRELAVRGALGAGRGRIVRQLLTESVLLGVAGGALGLAAAALILRGVPALAPGDVPRLEEVGVDGMVLAFSAGLSVVAGLVFGAVPALSWSRLHLVRALGEGSVRAAGGFRILSANRTRAALAVTQVALALVLLVGAGLLLRSFVRLVSVDPGYDAGNVLTAQVNHPDLGRLVLSGEFGAAGENAGRFTEALRERLARVEALRTVWHERPATARRVRQRISTVMDYAVALNYRDDNPCSRIGPVLGPQQDLVQHMRALPHRDAAAAVAKVRASKVIPTVKLAFEFLVLTAGRSGEVRGARCEVVPVVWTTRGLR